MPDTPTPRRAKPLGADRDRQLNGKARTIHGQIMAENAPVANVVVEAIQRDLRVQRVLGRALTNHAGRYRISYRPDQFTQPANASVEVVVRAVVDGTDGPRSAEGIVQLRIGEDAILDLSLPTAPLSEFERITKAVLPMLAGQGEGGQPLAPWELEDSDIDVLVDRTDLAHELLRAWVRAADAVHKEWAAARLDGDDGQEWAVGAELGPIAAEFCVAYAFLRTAGPEAAENLFRGSIDELIATAERAGAQGYIPVLDEPQRSELRSTLEARRVERALSPTADGQQVGLGDTLRMIPDAHRLELDAVDGPGWRVIANLLDQPTEDGPRWDEIRRALGDDDLFGAVRRSIRLEALTGGYAPMMKALQQRLGAGDPATLSDLVPIEDSDWVGLARLHGAPARIVADTEEERYVLYGRELATYIERTLPTAFIRDHIAKDRIPTAIDAKASIDILLAANPDFRFKDVPVLALASSDEFQPGGLNGDQIKAATTELLRVERVARLTPRLADVGNLMLSGYQSARDVVLRHSRNAFVADVRNSLADPADAERIYDAAAHVVASTEALVLSHSPRFTGRNLPVMVSPGAYGGLVYSANASTAAGQLIQPADLRQLFGNQDYCECSHGASIYSPAAYYADLLQMLARGPRIRNRTALDVLLERRPDLAELDLSGDNAEMSLPYIDLVAEILEAPAWDAGFAGFGFRVLRGGMIGAFDAELDQGRVPDALADDIASWGLQLGEHRTAVRGVDVQTAAGATSKSWLIRDQQSGLKVRLIGVMVTAYRMRVYPQSVRGMAGGYRPWPKTLSSTAQGVSTARFPWTLPFDVTRDEANTWLEHLGTSREAVMLAFAGTARWADVDAACEALNIGRGQRDALTTVPSPAAPAHRDWGFPNPQVGAEGVVDPIAGATGTFVPATGLVRWDSADGVRTDPPDWFALLRNVSLLRSRSRLTHRELLDVLGTRFVQREGTPPLEFTGDECNVGLMRLEQLDAPVARRIHLFVRLWRLLGWSTTDLDQAIAARATNTSGAAETIAFTDSLLVLLATVRRLHASSGIEVAQLIDLLGGATLDTTRCWDHSGAQPVQTLSRYQSWFDNPTLVRPRLAEFRLDAAGTALVAPTRPATGLPLPRLSDHHTYLSAVLMLTERELARLLPASTPSIAPVQASAGQTVGEAVDVGAAPTRTVEMVVGAMSAGATFSLQVEHANPNEAFTPVPAASIGGSNPLVIGAGTPVLTRLNYTGAKKLLRTTLSSTGGINPTVWITTRVLMPREIVTDELTLANLTTLARFSVLRRLVGKSADEVLTLMQLSGIDPLTAGAAPDTVLRLLEARDALEVLGLSIADAEELLSGPENSTADGVGRHAEALLSAIRGANTAIVDESTVAPEQNGALLTKVLRGMGWDEPLASRILSTEVLGLDWADYEVLLTTLPAGVALPAWLTYDKTLKRLVASRTLRPAKLQTDMAPLIAAATGKFKTALTAIKREAARRESVLATAGALLRARKLPTHRADVGAAVVPAFDVPAEWRGRFFFDRESNDLCFVGWMSDADAATLKGLDGLVKVFPKLSSIVGALKATSTAYQPPADNGLVVREGAATGLTVERLLLDTNGSQERCRLLLDELLPGWRRERLGSKVAGALAQVLACSGEVATALLELPGAPSVAAVPTPDFMSLVTPSPLLSSDPATRASRSGFPEAFDAAVRLLLLGNLVSRLHMRHSEVQWFRDAWTGLDLTVIPTTRMLPTAAAWSALSALASVFALKAKLPTDASGLRAVYAATASPLINFEELARTLGSDKASLKALAAAGGLNVNGAAWLREPKQLLQFISCLDLSRTSGIPTEQLVRLRRAQAAQRSAVEAEAETKALREVSLAARTNGSASDSETKVLDTIKLRRRDATVDFLVHERRLRDANDLYGYALIDPEMGPCMPTSRLVQAISSVQLFIQRCLMQLEPDAPPNAIDKDHWAWMKNYRVWEANRKVLLYPENWIEPELRDDKTPFFDELVSSLQQGDATGFKAEQAVHTFVERLSDFSQMEIVGTCSAYDDQNQLLATHMFARTLAEPHAYYHREFHNLDPKDRSNSLGTWSSWRAVGLDIEGNLLFPVVWQGRLFLFWAILAAEAVEPSAAELQKGQSAPSLPQKFWRLKLAWSEYKSGAWTSRRLAQDDLVAERIQVGKLVAERIQVGKPTAKMPRAAADPDWFYFWVAVQDAGVTINCYLDYEVVTTLFFDGQRAFRANGTYVRLANSTYQFTQTPIQVAEAPVDGNPPDRIRYHYRQTMEPLGQNLPTIATAGQGRQAWAGGSHSFTPPIPSVSSATLALDVAGAAPITVLGRLPRNIRVLYSPVTTSLVFAAPSPTSTGPIPLASRTTPFFVSDWQHRFFVVPTRRNEQPAEPPGLHFYEMAWLPAPRLRRTLTTQGIGGLLSYQSQSPTAHPPIPYFADYQPVAAIVRVSPDGDLEFSPSSASSTYNYELFFHVPFAIACALSKNQRFEEARQWFHYVFDPTDASTDPSPARYWRFRPFRELNAIPLTELLRRLADPADMSREKLEFRSLIAQWKDEPFKPHLVARMRLRSYMYAVVMKYLDNLLDWADQLFRRYTRESISEATQLYIMAEQILGRRPEGIPRRTKPVLKAYAELAASQPDELTNALVEAESLVANATGSRPSSGPTNLWSLYFCLPNNPKIDEYYDRVEDKLYNLRNCMNIDGAVSELALFEPPIDPGLLVKAAAAGVDLAAVLADSQAPLPLYRFNVMAQKATELCAEVRSLGAALLRAIEKGDAEALALMRSQHERDMLQGVRLLKETQLLEAKANLDMIGASLRSPQTRFTHYVGLVSELAPLSIPTGPVVGPTLERLGAVALETLSSATGLAKSVTLIIDPVASKSLEVITQLMTRTAEALAASLPPESMATTQVPLNIAEQRQLAELKSAHDLQQKAADQRLVAQSLALIPDVTLGIQGFSSSPVVQFQLGGTLLSKVAEFAASGTDSKANVHTYRANLHNLLAGYQRRAADWMLQAQLAAWEIAQIGDQLKAATLRVAIATQELQNHDRQAAQAVDQQVFMRSKFTNTELFSWMSGQLATLHFEAYQLAYDVAKRAERCFANELGVDASFIKFGYWDSLRKGLLAGESLAADIKRMEVAYLSQNAREFEITKNVSLRELDPHALVQLQETGECQFSVPEVLFDLDFPGHYFRRIKSIGVSVPCIVGTYTGVSSTLTLLNSKVRVRSNAFHGKYDHEDNFKVSSLPVQAIATSTGQNDAGMFELNFRDERYLPFEGAGVISKWRMELPADFRAFDYLTISDVVIHMRYTARQGGGALRQLAESSLTAALNSFIAVNGKQGFARLISLRGEFPSEWHRFIGSRDSAGAGTAKFAFTRNRFPYIFTSQKNITITIGKVDLFAVPKDSATTADLTKLTVTLPAQAKAAKLTNGDPIGRLQSRTFTANTAISDTDADSSWTFAVPAAAAPAFQESVDDILVLCHYTLSKPNPGK